MKNEKFSADLPCLDLIKVSFKHPQRLNKDYENRTYFHQIGILPNFAIIVLFEGDMLER